MSDKYSESNTERDGLFSYAFEQHAFVFGFGPGFFLGYYPESTLLRGMVVAVLATSFGIEVNQKWLENSKISTQVHREPQYLVGGLICGFISGLLVRKFA